MSKSLRNLVTAALTSAFLLGGAAIAAEEPSSQKDLSAFLCKDVMRLSGSDREISLAFAHGYMLGKKGTTQYDVEALAQITDQFIDYCLDHPAENALQSFEMLAK
jgi:hypothetical protein